MRGMRQRQHQSNKIFKQKLSKVMKRNLEVMQKSEHNIDKVWRERMVSLQQHYDNKIKALTQRLKQQQKKYCSEMKQLNHGLRVQLKNDTSYVVSIEENCDAVEDKNIKLKETITDLPQKLDSLKLSLAN